MTCLFTSSVKAWALQLHNDAPKYLKGEVERNDMKRIITGLRKAVNEVERSYGLRGRA